MAVTVLNQPTTPNATKTKLVYSITGSNVNQPQYQYVTDIYVSGSNTLLTRLFTYPNLQGSGIIDIARVLDDNLDYDNYWKITGSLDPVQAVKTFDLRFGEAYGTSISSSVTVYTGSTANYLKVFPGVIDPTEGSFNFNTSSFLSSSGGNNYLTNSPNFLPLTGSTPYGIGSTKEQIAALVNSQDYMSVTSLVDIDANPSTMEIIGYRMVNGFITGSQINIMMPASNPNSSFSTFGVGPQNLALTSSAWSASLADPNGINIYQSAQDTGEFVVIIKDKWDGVPVNPVPYYGVFSLVGYPTKPCNEEYTRFAWINNYGFWDYYNIYNPTRKVTNVDRKLYEQNYVNFSSNQSIYDITRRGETQYNTSYSDTYEITTNYLDKKFADWLTELFDSPDVYIQQQDNFIPIVITNTSYDWNMNENRQKLFQFTITYRYANQRYDR